MADPHPDPQPDPQHDPVKQRRTFGPVVLLGLAAAGLATVAGSKPWVAGESGGVDTDAGAAMTSVLSLDGVSESPLAAALGLVLLACWGVLLVTRGRVRRAIAALGLIAAVGLVVATVEAPWSLPDKLADALREVSGSDIASTSLTVWYPLALVAAGLSVVATLAAVSLVPSWPEMGTRYDAPAGAPVPEDAPTSANIDIWKAIDEGRDPTA